MLKKMPEIHRYRRVLRFFIIATFLLLPITAFLGYFVYRQVDLAKAQLEISAERLARIIAAQQEQQIRNIRNLLIGVSQFAELENRDAEGCNRTLELLLDHANQPFPYYLNLGVADINGDIFCTALPAERTINVADRYYFKRSVQTRGFSVGEYQTGRITGEESINFGYPVIDEVGRVKFVIFAAVSLDALQSNESRVRKEGHPTLIITDRNGTIVLRTEHSGMVGTVFPYHQDVHRQPDGSLIGLASGSDEYIFGFSTLSIGMPEDHLHLIVGIPLAQIVSTAQNFVKASVWIISGALLVALLLGWFLSRKIAERLLAHYR